MRPQRMLRPATVAALALAVGLGVSACQCGVYPHLPDGGLLTGGGAGGGSSGGGPGTGGSGGGFIPFDAGCTGPVRCYDADAGTEGHGACHGGEQQCHDGVLGPCLGQVLPAPESCNGIDDDCDDVVDNQTKLGKVTCGLGPCQVTVPACTNGKPTRCIPDAGAANPSGEQCGIGPGNGNGVDDNCDGLVDEGCSCVYVSTAGNDLMNSGLTSGMPVQTIQHGIDVAADAGRTSVCVSGGVICPAMMPPTFVEAVRMHNGVSVLGGYQEGSSWSRNVNCVVRLQDVDPAGLLFDESITSPTAIDGLTVFGMDGGPSNAAVSIAGATGAILSDSDVEGGAGLFTVGVDISSHATATLSRMTISGGAGTMTAIGVNSDSSTPTIVESCPFFDSNSGLCDGYCNLARPYIRGATAGPAAVSIAVRLNDSEHSVISRSELCAGPGQDAFGLNISGASDHIVVHSSHIESAGGIQHSFAVDIDTCGGDSAWLFHNQGLVANTPSDAGFSEGVRVLGDCPARIDSNLRIAGGDNTGLGVAVGVHCGFGASPSPAVCQIQNNQIFGSAKPAPSSAGVLCDTGSCGVIEANQISGGFGRLTWGVVLIQTGAVVRRNDIQAGCGPAGAGVLSLDSFARVENNLITGVVCSDNAGVTTNGVRAELADNLRELDLHSNTIFAGGAAAACFAAGVDFAVDVFADAGLPSGPRGIVRNNIVDPGACVISFAIAEESDAGDPYVVENNDLLNGSPGIYLDEDTQVYDQIAVVNVLTGAAANISLDPLFVDGGHIGPTSPCIDAGTTAGAPKDDHDGRPRIGKPDIGAFQH
jgi:hypothetical protein